MIEKMRRYRDSLKIMSTAVILYGLWTVLRTITQMILEWNDFKETVFNDTESGLIIVITVILLIVLLAISIFIRLFIGLNAKADANGKEKRGLYIIVTFILCAIDIAAFIIYLVHLFKDNDYLRLTEIVTIVIEISSIYILIDLIVSALKFRKVRKELKGGSV